MQTLTFLNVFLPAWIFIGLGLIEVTVALLYLLRGRRDDAWLCAFIAISFSAGAVCLTILIQAASGTANTLPVQSELPLAESPMDWEYFSRGEVSVQTFYPPVPGILMNRIAGEIAPGMELGIVYRDRIEGYRLALVPKGRTNGPIATRSYYATDGTNGLFAIDVAVELKPRERSF